ncbi:hypothetical protein ACH5RR_012162 [Cinchona calisaya]|uniref:Uncharacterized protein n=1 Tax=Cinchona calisaya TaxID=153742 RepID=A0ABD3A6W4_9GENT
MFQDVEWAPLIGAKPRGPRMERTNLLDINGQIFTEQQGFPEESEDESDYEPVLYVGSNAREVKTAPS